jgi:hypothetical protein
MSEQDTGSRGNFLESGMRARDGLDWRRKSET